MRTFPTASVAAIALLVLTACTAPHAGPASPIATASTSATPSPAPTPPSTSESLAVDPADPSTWRIGDEGIGPLHLGIPLDAAVALLPDYIADGCPNPNVRFLRADESTDPLLAIAAGPDGNVALITLYNAVGPSTPEGIRIGSAVTEVKAAYPAVVPSRYYTDRYTLEGSPGFITFATADVDDGDQAPIVTISVVAGGIPPSELCG